MRNFFLYLICLMSFAFAKSPLQENIEYEYPNRLMSSYQLGPDGLHHTTIIYTRAGYERRPNSENDFAEYDSTVDEAFLHKLYVNCRDSTVFISETGRYVDSESKMSLDHRVTGVYMFTGTTPYWKGRLPLIGVPCGFGKDRSKKKHR